MHSFIKESCQSLLSSQSVLLQTTLRPVIRIFFVLDSRRRIPRQVPVEEFSLCNPSDSGKFAECQQNVKLRCTVSTTTCIYVVSCPRRNKQYICDIPRHSYSHFLCCTPYC